MEYFASLRSALHLALVSKPIVSSRMYKTLPAVSKRRSGLTESPVITLGDGNDGRSMNRAASLIHCNEDATKFKRELWRHVYLPSSRHTYPPQDIPCIQQRHVVMILGTSRKSNQIFAKVLQDQVFTSCKCVVHVTYSEIKDFFGK